MRFSESLAAAGLLTTIAVACIPGDGKPAAYETELTICNESASTLAESIACENDVRRRYGRPARDGGTDAAAH